MGYVSQKWMYSLHYPASWFNLDNFGAPDTQKYFSNESVETPMKLDPSGIWLTIDVNPNATACSAAAGMSTPSVTHEPLALDGEPTAKYTTVQGVLVEVPHHNWCYTLSFVVNYTQARDEHMTEVTEILSSFRFNR